MKEELERIKNLMGITENKFSKTMRTLRGLEKNIHTVAIISPENPCGEMLDKAENKERREKFEQDLKNSAYSYRKVMGKYGVEENSYIINNISKEDAIRLGGYYEQDTIIYGERTENGMKFQMIQSNKCKETDVIGYVTQERNVYSRIDKNDPDNYTELKGRRFRIPFYDDDAENWDWVGGKIDKLNLTNEDQEKLDYLIAESLNENKVPRYRLNARADIKRLIKNYL